MIKDKVIDFGKMNSDFISLDLKERFKRYYNEGADACQGGWTCGWLVAFEEFIRREWMNGIINKMPI
jgi:hypothetical protein